MAFVKTLVEEVEGMDETASATSGAGGLTNRQLYRLIVWPVLMPSFLFSVGSGAMLPALVLAAIRLGASEALASAMMALVGGIALVSTVPVGVTIDRIGDKRAMAWATSTATVLFAVTVVALAVPSPWSLPLYVGSLVLRTPALTAWSLARQAVVAETVPTRFTGQAMTALGGTMRAGNLVGPLCGALLLTWWPLWSVFAFGALCAVAATALLFVRRFDNAFDERMRLVRASRTGEELAAGVRWKAVGLVGIAIFTLAVARVAQPILIALWGFRLGWSEAQISLIVAVGSAIEMLLMVPGGYLKDRIGRSRVLASCLVVYGSGFLLAPVWPTSFGFLIAVVVMSLGNGFGAGINMTIGADLSPVQGRARFLSVWAMFSNAGALGGPLAVSGLLVVASLPVAVTSIGVFAFAGAAWTLAWAPVTKLP